MDLDKRVKQITENIPDIIRLGKEKGQSDLCISGAIIDFTRIMMQFDCEDRFMSFEIVPFSFHLLDGTIIPF